METHRKSNTLCLAKDNALANFWASTTKLCFSPRDHNLEYQAIHSLTQLLGDPAHHLCAWDALRRSRLLSVVVRTLGSKSQLDSLVSSGSDRLEDYMRIVELASEANPYECMCHLTIDGCICAGLRAFLPLSAQLSLIDRKLHVYLSCLGSFVRTVSFILSDTRNYELLARIKLSPMEALLGSLSKVPTDRHDARLVVLRGVLQVLLHTSRFTKVWVEDFAVFNGPEMCLSAIVEWCNLDEDPRFPLNEESTVMFDMLCLFLSLPDSGRVPSHSLYLYLRASHWDADVVEPEPSVYTSTLGLFGLRVIVRALLATVEHRPTLFFYLSQLLTSAIRIGSEDVVEAGLVNDALVDVVRRHVCRCTDMEDLDLGMMISTIVRLCVKVCATHETYERQKNGAPQLCAFVVELASSPTSRVLQCTIQTIMLLCSFANEELFFTKLVSAQIFEELDKRLLSLSDPGEIHLVLQMIKEICTRVPSLQKQFLLTSGTLVGLIRTEVKYGPSLLLESADLLALVLVNSGGDTSRIHVALKILVTCTDFQSSGSVISGCWGLQTCVKAVKRSETARTYFASEIDSVLTCLRSLCVCMKIIFSSKLTGLDLCESFAEMWAYHRHQRDAGGVQQALYHCLLLCDFLVLCLHLLTLLQANSPNISNKSLSCELEEIVSMGPFLQCRLYTSIVARAVIGMCSLSSFVVFDEICAPKETPIVTPVTRQNVICGWEFQTSCGDDLFASKKQRIVYPEYLHSLQRVLCQKSKTAESALLSSSIVELLLDIFFNCLENVYTLVEGKTFEFLTRLFAVAIAENELYRPKCFERLVAVTRKLGTCGISLDTMLHLLTMCLRSRDVDFVEYDNEATKTLLSVWRTLLQESLPSTQPMSFVGISVGFPTITRFYTAAVSRVKRELGIYGGVDIPIQLTIPKAERCVSVALWFFIESDASLSVQRVGFFLVSLFLDQNRISLLLWLSPEGTLSLKVVKKVKQQLRSNEVPVPRIRVPTRQWCMVSMSVMECHQCTSSFRSKLRLEVRLSLFTAANTVCAPSTEVTVCVELSLGMLEKTEHLFREANMVSLGTASVPAGNQPVPLLFGALGMFGGPLSRVEASCLFVMGSDSLLSLSFMDKSFVVGLYPALANMVQQEESVLTDEIVLLSAMWRRRGISGAEDQVMFSGAVMPFSRYYNRERFPIVVGVRNGGLYLEANAERRGITGDTLERHEPDSASLNPSPGRVAKNKLVMPVSLMLSNDENEIRILGSIWARVNGPRFHSVSPVYSVLDAVGGIPFFAWLVSLQPTYSEAFEEAWKCVGDVILWHSTDNLLCCTPLHGGRHLVVLLKAMLHSRVVISKKTAVSLCRAVGNRMIVRTDLLPLLLDFTLWSQNSGGFQAVLHKLQEYVVDDQYGAFNSRILQNGVDSQYGADHSYALEEFLVHLLMHFAGDTNGDWDVSLISSATVFLATLCRTPLHMRRMVQAAICLVVGEDALASSVVDWALGLLSAVRQSMSVINPGSLDDEFLVSDIVTLLKCSKEVVRCNALSLLSWALISKEQLDTMVDEYLARKALFPDTLCISEAELCTVVCVVEQSARRGDTKGARTLLVFLVALLQHIPCDYQMRVVVLLCNVAKEKGPLIRDLVYPTDFSEKGFASIVSYLLGVLLILAKNEVTVTGLLVESLTSVAVYMIEVSWSTEGVNCGRALRDVVLTIFLAVSCLNDIEPRRRLELSDNKVNVLVSRFVVSSLDKFSILAGKGCSGSFMDDYVSFLQIAATAVILLDWCESNCRSSDESMVKKKEDDQGDTWVSQTLAGVYFSSFGKPLCLGDRHTVVRIALLLFECARKLLFELQAGQSGTLPRKRVKRLSEELLLLQWRVAASLLYNAEQNDDDVVRELTLLYLVYGGNAECSFNTPALAKQGALTQPPGGADWRLLRSSSNTVMSELLKRAPGEALKESAPWLIVLRAASSFLHPSLQGNQHRFSMALSVCQFVRYHAAVWSLVKGGASTSSLAELDAALKIDSGVPDAARSATLSNPLWDIELSRNGVATLERFLVTARASAFSMLRRCSAQSPPPLLFAEPRRAVQRRGQISADMHQFQASLWKKVTLYKKFVEEDGCAILASHAAYRFSLLPWWGQCINLYARTPVPLNRWELDRFLGTEWQHVRLRRFIHDVKITDAWSTDQLLRAVYKKDMAPTDDVRLLKLYSVTALPQLQATCVSGTYAFTVGCKLVLPMDRVPIVLCIASKHISYVVERFQHGLTQLGKEPSATSFDLHGGGTSTKVEVHNPISRFPKTFRCKCEIPCVRRVVDVSSVRAIWKRRNLLQPCALELLLSTGETLFLAFETEEMRRRVSAAIIAVTRPYLDKTLVMTESNLRMWRNWWCEGRITNFHYLMYLNFAAGRSYGDLRQYPVFPHVVADYLSDTLDLTNAASFRRFSKPMGAQTPDREQKAIAKYMEIAALGGTGQTMSIDLIPHHYGSHYSPLGGALHFLVRVQPFSDYFVNMNSKLDDADRVFDSMATAYTISTGKDVKEMLPEFYCLPDMFVNFNHIPFGTKQDGDIVNDVQLPPWASAPRELTQMLRQALESRYTSENLHSWIDLTFGYKQRGKEAIAAVNVFHPLTYERSIDLLAITDPVLKSSHETQIDCFGQTPSQLFSHPHKPRGKPTDPPFFQSPCPTLRYEASSWRFCVVLHPEQLVPMSSHRVDGTVVVFARSRSATAARGAEEGSEWKFPLTQARPVVLPKGCFPFTVTNDQLKDCLCIRGNGIVLVDGKDVSRDICTFHMSYGRVTTLAVDPPIVYVGMDSGAIHLMKITNEELNEVELPLEDENGQRADLTDTAERILRGEVRTTRTRSAVRRRLCVLYGHTAPVTTLFVSHEWGILVSSAEDYIVGVWDIERHILIRTISYPKLSAKYPDSLLTENIGKQWCGGEVWHYSLIAVNAKEGDIILAGHSLKKTYAVRLYSLNGSFVASYDLGKEPATALLSVGGVIFVAQGTTVRVLKESNMQWICDVTHSSIEDGIESLALDPGATILAACSRKSTLVTWRVVPSG